MSFKNNISKCKNKMQRCIDIENLSETLFDKNPAGIIITTLQDGRIIDINKSVLKKMGFSRDECLGRTLTELGVYLESTRREEIIKILIEKHAVYNQEISFLNKSGSLHQGVFFAQVIEFQNQPCIVSTIFDTARLTHETDSSHNRDEQLNVLIELIPDMILAVDYTGKIIYANRTAYERLGYSKHSIQNMHILNIHPQERKYDVVNIMGKVLVGEVSKCDIPLETAYGNLIPVETKLILTNWNDQNIILGISREIGSRE
ncbi:MAG: PAS domain-containing protein [Desulfamplus sp.]